MELALYCPVYGYYEKEGDTLGRRGDYYTSVSVGPLFGELLAWQFSDWLREGHQLVAGGQRADQQGTLFDLVEAGAHDGALAKDILAWLKAHRPEIFKQIGYCIVEPSEQRSHRQRETLADFGGKVAWFGALAELKPVRGIIFSNELLDAFPVHRLGWDAGTREWFEWGVDCRDATFIWSRLSISPGTKGLLRMKRRGTTDPSLQPSAIRKGRGKRHPSRLSLNQGGENFISPKLSFPEEGKGVSASVLGRVAPRIDPALAAALPEGFTIEVCPAAREWWRQAATLLTWGKLLTIDYGFAADEQFAPERSRGSLRAYQLHQVSDHLLENPGEQDLTAHIDFGALQSIGEAQGLRTEAFHTQAQFLTDIAARIWDRERGLEEWTAQTKRQFQTLTHPEHLGRAFRILVQSRP